MKKFVIFLLSILIFTSNAYALEKNDRVFELFAAKADSIAIKSVLNSQVRYANKTNFNKFISTYSKDYKNGDGFDLETYSNLVKDVWQTYDKIVYNVKINDIDIKGDTAIVNVTESSTAKIAMTAKMEGVLKSVSDGVYYLKKDNKKWKVVSEEVLREDTSMLYGIAKNMDISLTAPEKIDAGIEYTASLEFIPPKDIIAIASIAKDEVTYPQTQPKEVYRKFPEDNLLERLFVSNTDNLNEYIVASIGLTKANIEDLSIKLSLVGFGYKIIRVNVVPNSSEAVDDKNK